MRKKPHPPIVKEIRVAVPGESHELEAKFTCPDCGEANNQRFRVDTQATTLPLLVQILPDEVTQVYRDEDGRIAGTEKFRPVSIAQIVN